MMFSILDLYKKISISAKSKGVKFWTSIVHYSVEAVALRGPWRVCMIATEIPNTFLESSDIVLSLVPDQNWYLKVDQISPTLVDTMKARKWGEGTFKGVHLGFI